MTTKRLIAWDSNILIDAIQKDPTWWPEIRPVYRAAVEGRLSILVSEICVAEVCKLSGPAGMTHDDAKRKVVLFFQNMFIQRRPADRREADLAADLIRDFKLETCDAIIAATASIHGARVLFTRDGHKKKKKSKATLLECDGKIGDPPLPIRPPNATDFLNNPIFKDLHKGEP